MPTYEYACRDCGEHLEVAQSFTEDPLTVCPACDGRLRKVFSAAPVVFKGSGWHITDYGTGQTGKAASAGKSGQGEDGARDKAGSQPSSGDGQPTTDDDETSSQQRRSA